MTRASPSSVLCGDKAGSTWSDQFQGTYRSGANSLPFGGFGGRECVTCFDGEKGVSMGLFKQGKPSRKVLLGKGLAILAYLMGCVWTERTVRFGQALV